MPRRLPRDAHPMAPPAVAPIGQRDAWAVVVRGHVPVAGCAARACRAARHGNWRRMGSRGRPLPRADRRAGARPASQRRGAAERTLRVGSTPGTPGGCPADGKHPMKQYPETIDNAWDVLYRDYPEIYGAFTSFPYRPSVLQVIAERFDVAGKVIVDVGAGGGHSCLPLAHYAAQIIGVEPQAAMRALAEQAAREQGSDNVTFL